MAARPGPLWKEGPPLLSPLLPPPTGSDCIHSVNFLISSPFSFSPLDTWQTLYNTVSKRINTNIKPACTQRYLACTRRHAHAARKRTHTAERDSDQPADEARQTVWSRLPMPQGGAWSRARTRQGTNYKSELLGTSGLKGRFPLM